MAPIVTVSYRTYPFTKDGRDPVMEDVSEAVEKENLGKKRVTSLQSLSGLSYGTVANILNGKTRFPRYSTIAALLGCLGYQSKFERTSRFNLETEMVDAKRWNLRRKAVKLAAEERKRNQRRNARNGSRNNSASL